MAPIELRNWAPKDTKPTTDWKARDAAELNCFDVPFAIKELVQNIVGQALKDFRVREWDGFKREDLRLKSTEERRACKERLVAMYPGLLTGPHGISLANDSCLPLYVLSCNSDVPFKRTNLAIAVVLWATSSTMNALSFFNNHLDSHASFDSFVVDGLSTSKADEFAVGEKGKGFILAMQFLLETLDKIWVDEEAKPKSPLPQPGVSFRVGEQLGELKWKKTRREGIPDMLRVHLDDLTTRTISEYLAHKYQLDVDNHEDGGIPSYYDPALETNKMQEKAQRDLKKAARRRKLNGMDVHDKSVVRADEVCITIVGLDTKLDPETLFSAVYGIVPPLRAWRPRSTVDCGWSVGNVQFFLINGAPRFYLRDQFIPQGIHLNRLSINYHGDLNLSAERVMVSYDYKRVDYKDDLRTSTDYAFRTEPDLAIELAVDILTDDHSDGIAGVLKPRDKVAAEEYRVAFDAAMRRQAPAATLTLYPCSKNEEHVALFGQLDLEPFEVKPRALEILYESGAYLPIRDYARKILLESPVAADAAEDSEEGEGKDGVDAMLRGARADAAATSGRNTGSSSSACQRQAQPSYAKGLDRLRAVLQMVIPELEADAITIRKYDKVYPTAAWDKDSKKLAVALPKPCDEHEDGDNKVECFCWIIPVLEEAASTHTPEIPTKKSWSAFALCMGGDLTPKAAEAEVVLMDVDEPAATTSTPARQSRATASTSSTVNTITASNSPRKSTSGSSRSRNVTQPARNATTTTTTSGSASTSTQKTTSSTSTTSSCVSPSTQQTNTISSTVQPTQPITNATSPTSSANQSTPSAGGAPSKDTATVSETAPAAANNLSILSPTPSPGETGGDSYELANEKALAQLTSAIRGHNSLKLKHDVLERENAMYRTTVVSQGKKIDYLNGRIDVINGRVVKLEEENKSLLETVGEYEEDAERMAERRLKRQRTRP